MTSHQEASEGGRITPLAATARCGEYRAWRDFLLFLRAMRLFRLAQGVRDRAFAEVLVSMCSSARPQPDCELERVVCATLRAGRHGRRWFGWLDSCLTRSLVAGALAKGQRDVVLHVGFLEKNRGAPVNGHAWVTVGPVLLLEDRDPESPDEPYRTILKLPMDEKRDE